MPTKVEAIDWDFYAKNIAKKGFVEDLRVSAPRGTGAPRAR